MLTQCSPSPMCHVSHVMCHMSHVACHMSHVTCHMSHEERKEKRRKNGESGGAYRSRVCYQRGLPRLVLVFFLLEINIFFIFKFSYIVEKFAFYVYFCKISAEQSDDYV